jgi:Rap1a immunity proteins
MKSGVVALSIFMAGVSQSSAQDQSVKIIKEGCQVVASRVVPANMVDAARSSYCLGLVKAILFVGRGLDAPNRFCQPDGVSLFQANLVFLKYLDDNPDKTNEPPEGLAIAAFRAEWPCQ